MTISSVAHVVDGMHSDGEAVTVTGVVDEVRDDHHREEKCVAVRLATYETAVTVHVCPDTSSEDWQRLASIKAPVTVTGLVNRAGKIPAMIATSAQRVAVVERNQQ